MPTHYERTKSWRKRNPKMRAVGKKRHYQQTQNAKNGYARWTDEHTSMITADDRPSDRELSKILGRSMQAIQSKRVNLAK